MKCRLIHSGWYLPQHAAQLRRDPLRQHGRHLGADADELDVRDRPQLAQDPVEPLVAQGQRIAAGEQHVADRRRAADVVERLFQPGLARAAISPWPTTRDRVQ